MKLLHLKEEQRKTVEWSVCIILLTALFFASFQMFRLQAEGVIRSDLPTHIETARAGRGYSLCSLILRGAYRIAGNNGCAAILAVILLGTVFAVSFFFQQCRYMTGSQMKCSVPCLFSFSAMAMFLGSIWIPGLYPLHYLHPEYIRLGDPVTAVTQPWHNSTYLLMRLLAFLSLGVFIRMVSDIKGKGYSWKEWLALTFLLALTNFAKPNFFLVFAPAAAIFLLIDWVRNKQAHFARYFGLGIAMLCSAPILLIQSSKLFTAEPAEAEVSSSITITLETVKRLAQGGNILFFFLSGLSFVLVITLCLKQKNGTNLLLFGWLIMIIAIGEFLLLKESGPRENHANFLWGLLMAGLTTNLIAWERWTAFRQKSGKIIRIIVAVLLISMELSGFVYFIKVFTCGEYIL